MAGRGTVLSWMGAVGMQIRTNHCLPWCDSPFLIPTHENRNKKECEHSYPLGL